MYADYSEGGLKFPNIQCMINTQLVKWVQRYFRKSDHNWTLPFEYFFRPYGGKTIFYRREANGGTNFIRVCLCICFVC